jgi:hypothetical protein
VTSTDGVVVSFTDLLYGGVRTVSADTTVDDTRGIWLSGYAVESGAGGIGVQRVELGVNTGTAKWAAYVTVCGFADPSPSSADVRVYYTYFA